MLSQPLGVAAFAFRVRHYAARFLCAAAAAAVHKPLRPYFHAFRRAACRHHDVGMPCGVALLPVSASVANRMLSPPDGFSLRLCLWRRYIFFFFFIDGMPRFFAPRRCRCARCFSRCCARRHARYACCCAALIMLICCCCCAIFAFATLCRRRFIAAVDAADAAPPRATEITRLQP